MLSDFNAEDSFDTDTDVVGRRVDDGGMVVNAVVCDVDTDRMSASENFMMVVFYVFAIVVCLMADRLICCYYALAKDYDIMIGAMVDKVMDYLRLVAAGQLFHGVDCLFARCLEDPAEICESR